MRSKQMFSVNSIGPRVVYDEAKRFAEAITTACHRLNGLDTEIVRISNTYAPRMRLNDRRVVPAFIGQALNQEEVTVFGDGRQTLSFCYVSDLIERHFPAWNERLSRTGQITDLGVTPEPDHSAVINR